MTSRKRNAILEEFINMYKSEPCLWRVKCKDYHDKNKKRVAYKKLVAKLREMDPTATRDDAVKKINALRSNYRRQKKALEESLKSGEGIQKPTLWYYDLFNFLEDQDVPPGSPSSQPDVWICEDSNGPTVTSYSENSYTVEKRQSYSSRPLLSRSHSGTTLDMDNSIENNMDNILMVNMDTSEDTFYTEKQNTSGIKKHIITPEKAEESIPRPREKKTDQDQITKEILLCLRDRLKRPAPTPTSEDRYDLLGRSIAIKLRSMEKRQALIAEKIINDTLFDAEMGNLNIESCQKTEN